MSHNNLMSLYCFIEDQNQEINDELDASQANTHQNNFAEGRRQALAEFENFLHDALDRKLPRRIYRQLKAQSSSCDSRYAVGK